MQATVLVKVKPVCMKTGKRQFKFRGEIGCEKIIHERPVTFNRQQLWRILKYGLNLLRESVASVCIGGFRQRLSGNIRDVGEDKLMLWSSLVVPNSVAPSHRYQFDRVG